MPQINSKIKEIIANSASKALSLDRNILDEINFNVEKQNYSRIKKMS